MLLLAMAKLEYFLYTKLTTKTGNVNLLLLTQGEKAHYAWIKDISRLLSKSGYDM